MDKWVVVVGNKGIRNIKSIRKKIVLHMFKLNLLFRKENVPNNHTKRKGKVLSLETFRWFKKLLVFRSMIQLL